MPQDESLPVVGILMLESRFPRIPGDIGNPKTWEFPVKYEIVQDATPYKVVCDRAKGLLKNFVEAGNRLAEGGAGVLTTSCGFLSIYQEELSRELPVPVLSSSLMQVGLVNQILPPGQQAGVLTISSSSLSKEHLQLAGVPDNTPIGTTEGGQEFTRVILNDEPDLDVDKARQDNLEAALQLKNENPQMGAIVLECTNMSPYARDIALLTGLPVFGIVTLVNWLRAGLVPNSFR
ncbi:MAG: aspartate/glutamate racemase family protein [Rhizobiaceae bacterium]